MANSLSPQSEELSQSVHLSPRSCLACSKRKIKCDRNHPCLSCAERGLTCIFPENTKRRPRGPGKKKAVGTKDADMKKRVSKLESLLEHLSERLVRGHTLHIEENCNEVHTANSVKKRGSDQCVRLGGTQEEDSSYNRQDLTWLVENNGRSLYINNAFWASLSDEIDDLHELLDGNSEESSRSMEKAKVVPFVARNHDLIFGARGNLEGSQTLLISPSQIQICGSVYLKNVQPVFPIFHKQQTKDILQKAVYQSTSLSKSEVVHLAVLSFAAVMSMPAEDVEREFGKPKPALLQHYQHAAENALTEAELMSTNDLGTLQAFVLFVICLRRLQNARYTWILVGLALRIALALGLHRDGEKFNLPPFQTEMRRRLWWQIYVLEIRAAEDQGCNSTINRDSFDTQLPLNINDEDIKVDSTSAPIPVSGFTDMTFSIVRFETVLLSHTVQPDRLAYPRKPEGLTTADKLRKIATCEEKLQTDYLQFVSREEPRTIASNIVVRTAIAKMKLAIHSPFHRHSSRAADSLKTPEHASSDEKINEKLFLLSTSVLEDMIFLSAEPSLKQWAWASQKHIHWHPLIFVLTELCHRPFSSLTERAWKAVDGVLQSGNILNAATISGRDAVLWKPTMRLMEKARRNSGAFREAVTDAVPMKIPTRGGNETVQNIVEVDNTEAREHIGGDFNLLDCPVTLSTTSLTNSISPPFVSSSEFNQICENYPQSTWDSSMGQQLYFDMLGDESTYFQDKVLGNTGDWW